MRTFSPVKPVSRIVLNNIREIHYHSEISVSPAGGWANFYITLPNLPDYL